MANQPAGDGPGRLRSEWRIKHQLPGRIRFCNDALYHNPGLAEGIRRTLGSRPGVQRVAVNPDSGTVLVCYEESREAPTRLMEAVVHARPAPGRDLKDRSSSASGGAPGKPGGKDPKPGGKDPKDDDPHAPAVRLTRGLKNLAAAADQGLKRTSGGRVNLRKVVMVFLAGRVGMVAAEDGPATWDAIESLLELIVAWTLYQHPRAEQEFKQAEDRAKAGP